MLSTLFRKLVTALVFGVAFVINPAYVTGCGPTIEEPDFGEAEMVALLDDLNAMGVSEIESDDALYEVELTVAQAEGEDVIAAREPSPLASTAHACGSRTFMKSAAACGTSTALSLEGTLTIRRVDGDAPVVVVEALAVSGLMEAYGDRLRTAYVNLELEGGGSATWYTDNAKDFVLHWLDAQDLGEEGVDIGFALAF
jgi:hypothetical protein